MQRKLATLEDAVARALVGGYAEWTLALTLTLTLTLTLISNPNP